MYKRNIESLKLGERRDSRIENKIIRRIIKIKIIR